MAEFLEVDQVSYGYEKAPVVKDLSFSLAKGQFLGIIGPNGAGKTTLLKMINRALSAQRGQILLEGLNLRDLSQEKIAQAISMVGQDLEASFSLTVLDLVLMGRLPHLSRFQKESKSDLEIARQCLELTETADLAGRQLNQLSAGERQRVILAKALAQKPRLLLLDEPTAHLDIGHQVKIFDLLVKLNQEQGLTIVAVLHDLNLAAEFCEQLLLLDQGKVVSQGSCKEVLQYASLEKTYGICVLVQENPCSRKPYVLPISAKYTAAAPGKRSVNETL